MLASPAWRRRHGRCIFAGHLSPSAWLWNLHATGGSNDISVDAATYHGCSDGVDWGKTLGTLQAQLGKGAQAPLLTQSATLSPATAGSCWRKVTAHGKERHSGENWVRRANVSVRRRGSARDAVKTGVIKYQTGCDVASKRAGLCKRLEGSRQEHESNQYSHAAGGRGAAAGGRAGGKARCKAWASASAQPDATRTV